MVAEGIQTILRREGYPKPYETLKALTRTNATVTAESIAEFVTLRVFEINRVHLMRHRGGADLPGLYLLFEILHAHIHPHD